MPQIITPALIQALFTGFNRIFQDAIEATPTDWEKVATPVPSTSKSNTYGWLGQFPQFREWIGDRVLKDMEAQAYQIVNKHFESTVSVNADDIEDDNLGIYAPMVSEMGRASKAHPDELVFALLKAGISTLCYDGQNFFDTDHPVYANSDGTGAVTSVANFDPGPAGNTNPTWYLLDTTRALKPVIFQKRKDYTPRPMINPDDEQVFTSNVYRWGVDARVNAGFGFWQFAYASTAPLTGDNYGKARNAMQQFKADGGRPLGIRPNLLVVPPSLEGAARQILVFNALEQNVWFNTAELLTTPWLA